ncbi:M23 family metallopeptidase [Sphingomonas sp. RS6]
MQRGRLIMVLVAAALIALIVSRIRIVDGSAPPSRQPSAVASPARPAALLVPVRGVPRTALRSNWGEPRDAGARPHHGIDILAPRGTPVLAAAAGTIEKRFESEDGGHTLYIRRRDPSRIDYYAHLDRIDVAEGQQVNAGDPIATVGTSGNAEGGPPHLHFEVKAMAPGEGWWQGRNIDPYRLLAANRAGS